MAYKLLLADDSITIQKVVELTLSEEDFQVTAVGDGEAALETARKLMPDIVLADVFMPKMDGYELCGKLKEDPSLKAVPVILLAGTFEAFDEARAAKVGAADHLTKPFESADLISMTKKLVELSKAAPVEEALLAEPVEEALFADEPVMAVQADTDDLWSVVDMGSADQPLAEATKTLTEEDLWKRANLVADTEETAIIAAEDEGGIPWDILPVEPLSGEMPEEEPLLTAEFETTQEDIPEVEVDEPASDSTAILNMDDLRMSWGEMEPAAIEVSEVPEPMEAQPFEAAVEAEEPPPAAPAPSAATIPSAAPPTVSPEMVREEVLRAVRETLDAKVKEALAGISRDMIERVVWEVVPDLAEEIIAREIEKLKAGIK